MRSRDNTTKYPLLGTVARPFVHDDNHDNHDRYVYTCDACVPCPVATNGCVATVV